MQSSIKQRTLVFVPQPRRGGLALGIPLAIASGQAVEPGAHPRWEWWGRVVGTMVGTLLGVGLVQMPAAHGENLEHMQQLLATRQCSQCDLSRAGLVYAQLDGANLQRANLSGANLSRANLQGADLRAANLVGASLVGANLTGARLDGAQLVMADLRGAYLGGAILTAARLDNALLQGAVGLATTAGRAEDFYAWALEDGRQKNYGRAAENFTQAISRHSAYAEAYIGRAGARMNLGDRDRAIADAEQAEKLFTAQNKPQEAQLAQALVKQMKTPLPSDRVGGSNFGSNLLSVFGTLAQFLLLF
jgi:uncharacterized protein YjbI with pentapeptide repeats